MDTSKPLAIIVAGGTGGHLYPGIAAARALVRKPGESWQVLFIVRRGDRGKELLEREGFAVVEFPGQGLPRRLSFKLLTFPFMLITGFVKAYRLLATQKPRVVLGMGGYLSFPVLLAARLQHRPTMIHEQNVLPGVSNRLLSHLVKTVAVSFADSEKAFPAGKVRHSGLPVRPEIGTVTQADGRRKLNLAENRLTFLVFGGSQGARRLNESALGAWPMLSEWKDRYQVLHVTGERDYEEFRRRYEGVPVQAHVMAYCHDMPAALAAADFVLCRSGASTVAELIVAQKPALVVPFPFASENHQFYNAEVLVKRGVAELIPDTDLGPAQIAESLRHYFKHPERLDQMRTRLASLATEEPHRMAAGRLADIMSTIA